MARRDLVFAKYNGHCAYCGQKIEIKDMQIDHIRPKCNGGLNSIENLNPSCRLCNHYKRSLTLEKYRELLKTLHLRIEKDYKNKVAIKYGLLKVEPFDGKFYFEKLSKIEVSNDR